MTASTFILPQFLHSLGEIYFSAFETMDRMIRLLSLSKTARHQQLPYGYLILVACGTAIGTLV